MSPMITLILVTLVCAVPVVAWIVYQLVKDGRHKADDAI